MPAEVTTYLLTQGILGVLVLVLAGIVVKLYNDNKQLERDKLALVESRRVESNDTTKEVLGVVSDFSQNIRILTERIDVSKSKDTN